MLLCPAFPGLKRPLRLTVTITSLDAQTLGNEKLLPSASLAFLATRRHWSPQKAQLFSISLTGSNNKEKLLMNTENRITTFRLSRFLGCILISGLLSSCAMMEAQKTQDKEQLLIAAGFKMKLADTPEKMAHLKTLTQHKIVPHQKDGKVYYIYADATTCQCFYWGQDQSYQNFMELQEQQNIADEDRMTAQMNEEEFMNWDTMGYGMGGDGMGFY